MQIKDLLLRSALARMTFLSCGERIILLNNIDNVAHLALLSKEELERMFSRRITAKFWDQNAVVNRAERDIKIMKFYDMELIVISDEEYPPLLKEIPQVPFGIFCRGNKTILSNE